MRNAPLGTRPVHIDEVRAMYKGHWFSPSNMRFFKTRVSRYAYTTNDNKYYFVSSERGPFDTSSRKHTVRVFCKLSQAIETVGDFSKLSRTGAYSVMYKTLSDELAETKKKIKTI